uniref:QRICH1-like domain-containing protein n=1 Tax=Branchiostoma floridae TaxID=7739 RepID=C3ZUQ4_BRAFL|eukprot:XP_002587755.1 hypothetical protein BRAFLDRAFT_94659 [Branchiostoma floridae]
MEEHRSPDSLNFSFVDDFLGDIGLSQENPEFSTSSINSDNTSFADTFWEEMGFSLEEFQTHPDPSSATAAASTVQTTLPVTFTTDQPPVPAVKQEAELEAVMHEEMNFWLMKFIFEVRRRDGKPYPPKTLYCLVSGLMRHFREDLNRHDMNFLDRSDIRFAEFRKALDAKMKELTAAGVGVTKRQADPLTTDDEDRLWESNTISLSTSEGMLYGVYFYSPLQEPIEHLDDRYESDEWINVNPNNVDATEYDDDDGYESRDTWSDPEEPQIWEVDLFDSDPDELPDIEDQDTRRSTPLLPTSAPQRIPPGQIIARRPTSVVARQSTFTPLVRLSASIRHPSASMSRPSMSHPPFSMLRPSSMSRLHLHLSFVRIYLSSTRIYLSYTRVHLSYTRIYLSYTRIYLSYTRIYLSYTRIYLSYTRIYLSSICV